METHARICKPNWRALPRGEGGTLKRFVREAIERLADYDARFIEAVEEGSAVARRDNLVEHDVVVERIENMFRLQFVRWTRSAPSRLDATGSVPPPHDR